MPGEALAKTGPSFSAAQHTPSKTWERQSPDWQPAGKGRGNLAAQLKDPHTLVDGSDTTIEAIEIDALALPARSACWVPTWDTPRAGCPRAAR